MAARFLTIDDLCEILVIEKPQAYALLRRGEIRGMKLGGRGEWRIEASELESFIQRSFEQTQADITAQAKNSAGSTLR